MLLDPVDGHVETASSTPHDSLIDYAKADPSEDYSSSIVPLTARKPLRHFQALFFTLWSGFPYLFLGFALNQGGLTLGSTTLIMMLGVAIYFCYGMAAAYLGSQTGQTHSLLSRSIFGIGGSVVVSLMVAFTQLGWAGFQGNLMAQMLGGLYGWNSVLLIGVIGTVIMVANNYLGFEGISKFARWVVLPLVMLWTVWLLVKAFTTAPHEILAAHPHSDSPLTWLTALGLTIGFASWGAEPDMFRYAKPRFWWSSSVYIIGLVPGIVLAGVAGWIMRQMAGTSDFGPALKTITDYSLFGAVWLAFIMVVVSQVSNNDGNYYEAINALENLLGGIRGWHRRYTCLLAAAIAGLAAWLVPYVFTDGFVKIASFGAIGIPTATVIMATDHFIVPRLFKIVRPMTQVPSWRTSGPLNVPGVIALVVAVVFGSWASGILPGEDPSRYLGIVPLETWVLGALLYLIGVAVVRFVPAKGFGLLGFSMFARSTAPSFGATTQRQNVATGAESAALFAESHG
jgi:purine-cytosine permease-like protein